jgi:transcriptional regulator with XRE-family HTH domain
MTLKSESIYIAPTGSAEENMNLFDFSETTPKQRAEAAETLHAANVARAIFHRRLDAGWSQGHLAALARTTQARVSEIESLKGDPKLSTLGRVAFALGCMIDVIPIAPMAATAPVGYTSGGNYTMTTVADSVMRNSQFQVAESGRSAIESSWTVSQLSSANVTVI